MPKYNVFIPISGYNVYVVDAENEDEALEKAYSLEEDDFEPCDNPDDPFVELVC